MFNFLPFHSITLYLQLLWFGTKTCVSIKGNAFASLSVSFALGVFCECAWLGLCLCFCTCFNVWLCRCLCFCFALLLFSFLIPTPPPHLTPSHSTTITYTVILSSVQAINLFAFSLFIIHIKYKVCSYTGPNRLYCACAVRFVSQQNSWQLVTCLTFHSKSR